MGKTMGLARRWRVGRGNSASLVLLLGGGGLSRLPWVLLRPGGREPHTVAQVSLQNTASAAGSAASALGRHFAEMNPGRCVVDTAAFCTEEKCVSGCHVPRRSSWPGRVWKPAGTAAPCPRWSAAGEGRSCGALELESSGCPGTDHVGFQSSL